MGNMDKCRAKVGELAQLLDGQKPDWYQVVDLATLDQASTAKCVLGQNWGTYSQGLNQIGARNDFVGGFAGGCHTGDSSESWSARDETEAWREQILVRLGDTHGLLPSSDARNADKELTATPETGVNTWSVDQAEYSRIEFPDGRYAIVPSEWMDKATTTVICSGRKVTEFSFEWESRS